MRLSLTVVLVFAIVFLSCRDRIKPIPVEPIPEVPNPYLGKWENVEFKLFNYYSLENGLSSNKIDSSFFGKYLYKYNFISNTELELNYGDTQKVIQPLSIINENTFSIKPISGQSKEYNVLRVSSNELILENLEPSFVTATTRFTVKKREIWKKIP
jgi:hypothetical protein